MKKTIKGFECINLKPVVLNLENEWVLARVEGFKLIIFSQREAEKLLNKKVNGKKGDYPKICSKFLFMAFFYDSSIIAFLVNAINFMSFSILQPSQCDMCAGTYQQAQHA